MDMFLSLQVFAFERQNMTFIVNVLLTCIQNCDAGLVSDKNCLVGRFLSRVSYLASYVFHWRRRSFTSRKLL